MGLFSKRQERVEEPPVRRGQVARLLQLHMAESDADPDATERASAALGRESRRSTPAERRAASAAARRNGY